MALLITLALVSTGTFAQQGEEQNLHPYLTNKFMLNVGMFFPDKHLNVSAGTDIDLPEPDPQLGIRRFLRLRESEDVEAFQFRWNFENRWWLDLEYFNTDMDESIRLENGLIWQDITFQEGSFVNAGIDFEVRRFILGREFLSRPDQELGIGFGVHWLDIGGFIEGETLTDQGESSFVRRDVEVSGPLPNINIWYMKSLTPRWAFMGRVDWLSASVGRYSGDFWNISAGVNFALTPRLGITARYQHFEIDVSVDESSWKGNIEVYFDGPSIFLSTAW